jgi:hypothetical protein
MTATAAVATAACIAWRREYRMVMAGSPCFTYLELGVLGVYGTFRFMALVPLLPHANTWFA